MHHADPGRLSGAKLVFTGYVASPDADHVTT